METLLVVGLILSRGAFAMSKRSPVTPRNAHLPSLIVREPADLQAARP
jgi:hypothetical protein